MAHVRAMHGWLNVRRLSLVALVSSALLAGGAPTTGAVNGVYVGDIPIVWNKPKDPCFDYWGLFIGDTTCVPVADDDATAKAFVNYFLQKIFDSGDWARLYEVTIGEFVEGATPTPPSLRSVPGSE